MSLPPAANARKCDRRRFSYSISLGLLPRQPQRFLNDCYPVALALSVMKVFGKTIYKAILWKTENTLASLLLATRRWRVAL